jgi:dihydrofolate reductase
MIKLTIIAAHDSNSVIGFNNQLPWSVPEDLAFFKRVTMGKPVIMGRKTHESIGFALPGRENIVITSKASRQFKGCITSTSLEAAIAYCEHREEEEAFIIGGAMLYGEALKYAHKLLLTEIQQEFVGDAHFPRFDRNRFIETMREVHVSHANGIPFHFVTYEREDILRQRQETDRMLALVRAADPHPHDSSMKQSIQELIVEACRKEPLPDAYGSFIRNLTAVAKKKPMSKKIKHPQHILVIDKEYTDEMPGMSLQHGVRLWKSEGEYNYWTDHAKSHVMTGQREKMETDTRFRQILPYVPVIFSDTPDAIDFANSPIFLYQRTKKVGEQRLGKKFSIGTGGHVDHADVWAHESIYDFGHTIAQNLVREVATEELVVTVDGALATPNTHPELFKFLNYGLIRDDGDNVGKLHLGVVSVIVLPTRAAVRCKEDELITCTPMSATMLKDANLEYEGWTQILIDSFLGLPMSRQPAVPREFSEMPFTGEHYIVTKEGDTWVELAIEYDVTVATLYRLNMASFDSNEIEAGTRVNIPQQQRIAAPLKAPEALIDALNNDKDGSRAKVEDILSAVATSDAQARMTEIVLKGILDHGPDYENVGLRFLVSQAMADRLVALNSGIADLIEKGIVVIVDPESLPRGMASMTCNEETAQLVKDSKIEWQYVDFAEAGVPGEEVGRSAAFPEMPNPTEQDLADPIFEAIWQTIKGWDVNVPTHYAGYCGANGSHVKMILDSVVGILPGTSAHNGALNITGDLALSQEELEDVEAGFRRAVELGVKNNTLAHHLVNGDSINSICEKYGISNEDFTRWNGFERGHAWPTHTGYVFVADPSIPRPEANSQFAEQYRNGTRSLSLPLSRPAKQQQSIAEQINDLAPGRTSHEEPTL